MLDKHSITDIHSCCCAGVRGDCWGAIWKSTSIHSRSVPQNHHKCCCHSVLCWMCGCNACDLQPLLGEWSFIIDNYVKQHQREHHKKMCRSVVLWFIIKLYASHESKYNLTQETSHTFLCLMPTGSSATRSVLSVLLFKCSDRHKRFEGLRRAHNARSTLNKTIKQQV